MNFDAFIAKCKDQNPVCENDYIGEDGLLYCGKCNTRKEFEYPFLGKMQKLPVMCKCKKEKEEAEEAERKKVKRQLAIEENRNECFQTAEMRDWTFENDDGKNESVTNAMKKYVEKFDDYKSKGKGLLLCGKCGSGKTYAACEVANALLDEGYRCLVTNFSSVLNELQSTYDKNDYIDYLDTFDLLVIDDLGIERKTEYAAEQVFGVIDARYRTGLPMIITTNYTLKDIANPISTSETRVFSRIMERCFPIEFKGEDRRRQFARDEYSEMKKELGL